MSGYVDIIWWIGYLIPLAIGFGCGWWIRGVKADEDERTHEQVASYFRGVEQAKRAHPAYREGYYEERLF